jgi:glycosyltransferase involved in cell wall biosynthesis
VRVLIASDHFPPFIGGGHRWAALLSSGLARRGHAVTVATMWHGGLPEIEHHGPHRVVVHRLRQLRTPVPALVRNLDQRHSPPLPDPLMIARLRRVIRSCQPEVVLSHGWISAAVVQALRGTSIPLVLSSHDYGYFCAIRILLHDGAVCSGPAPRKCLACASGFYGKPKGVAAVAGVASFRRAALPRIVAVQSVSTFVDDMNGEHFIGGDPHRDRIERFVIPAFVDADPPDEADERLVRSILAELPDEPFILFVGAIRPVKGIEVLFDAYRRLREPPPLVLMGTIEQDTPDPFPTGAIVLTDVPHVAVMEGWSRALFGVVPSVWPEPLGTVSLEGIMQGAPVIATAPSGMVDTLGDGAGVLVPQGDAAALAEAMQSLIDDPVRRQQLCEAGKARAAQFDAEAVLDRYEKMLTGLIAG